MSEEYVTPRVPSIIGPARECDRIVMRSKRWQSMVLKHDGLTMQEQEHLAIVLKDLEQQAERVAALLRAYAHKDDHLSENVTE